MKRLHKQGFLEFGEDVKKRLRLLSEELLLTQKREEKTYVFVRHFFGKKNGGERGIRTLDYSPCEITLKKMFYSAF